MLNSKFLRAVAYVNASWSGIICGCHWQLLSFSYWRLYASKYLIFSISREYHLLSRRRFGKVTFFWPGWLVMIHTKPLQPRISNMRGPGPRYVWKNKAEVVSDLNRHCNFDMLHIYSLINMFMYIKPILSNKEYLDKFHNPWFLHVRFGVLGLAELPGFYFNIAFNKQTFRKQSADHKPC